MSMWLPAREEANRSLSIASDLQDKIQNGYAPLGWPGDPSLYIQMCAGDACPNTECEGWALWRKRTDGQSVALAHNKHGGGINEDLIKRLVKADPTRRPVNEIVGEIDEHNDRITADIEQRRAEREQEGAERISHILRRM